MRIVIIGAGGQIGSELALQLGYAFPEAEIIGTKRKLNPIFTLPDKPLHQNTHIILFDPFKDDWQKLGKVSVIINAVGIIRETQRNTFQKIHEGLTNLLIANRAKLGNPKIIQFSVLGANAASTSDFLNTKGRADATLLQEPNTVVIRPSIVCTPNTVFVKKLQMLEKLSKLFCTYLPFPSELLKIKIQPVMVDDITDLVIKLCTKQPHPNLINIGGPERITLNQFLQMLPVKHLHIFKISPVTFNRMVNIVTGIFPALLNAEQYQLLRQHNITETAQCENILNRPLTSTRSFWKRELNLGS